MEHRTIPPIPDNKENLNNDRPLNLLTGLGVAATTVSVAFGAIGCVEREPDDTSEHQTSIEFTAEPGDTLSGELADYCPESSAAQLSELTKQASPQVDPANPDTGSLSAGETYTVTVDTSNCKQ